MNNRGFTLMELIAVIVIVGLLSFVAISALSKNIEGSYKKTYKNFEQNLKSAAKDYYSIHTDLLVPGGAADTVDAAELHDAGYLDNLIDPKDKQACDYTNSYVTTSASYASAGSYNLSYTYTVCLVCPNYRSKTCS